MARVPGTFNISSNYDVSVKKPFDARMLVPTYADLILKSNWQIVETTEGGTTKTSFVAYNGMLVAVADKNDVANSGLYMLFDVAGGKNPDVENPANWLKIGETSEIGDFVERISQIETEIADIKDRLSEVEDKQPEVYAYRTLFPSKGAEGKIYIAVDEQKSYVWIDDVGYLCVGEENPDIICGGDASEQ